MPPLALAPLVAAVTGALASLLIEAFVGRRRSQRLAVLAAVTALAAAGVFIGMAWGRDLTAFGGKLSLDPLALLLMALVVVASFFVLLMSLGYGRRRGINLGQLAGLVLLASAGLMIMVSSTDWLVVFLGLEVLSVASYALTGLWRTDRASAEAAAKYFLFGSFAGAFFVFGLALLYGTTGRLDFGAGWATGAAPAAGLGLIVAALFFKIAVAPFHMWAPDVYEGAPTPVTVFLTIVPKAAGLAVLLRALAPHSTGGPASAVFGPALSVASVLTMFAANLAALKQKRVKRILAYSAIAHSGYLLIAVVSADAPSLVFYLFAYLFMNAGAFGVLAALSGDKGDAVTLSELAGLGRRHPWLAASLAVFLLSLAGLPPTAGFLAKFYVFAGAVAKGHVLLAVAAVLASLASVAYYLRIIVAIYMEEPVAGLAIEPDDPPLDLVVFLCLFGVVQLGIWPGNILVLIRQSLAGLF
jgi:NADH-quinone oxidoreductase subunit N